jgi:N-methylhydantoinase B
VPFTGVLPFAVRSILEKHGVARMQIGDVFATNDPIPAGTHLSDVCLIGHLWKGELIAFSANKAHWTEVGGM